MAFIDFRDVSKVYSTGTKALSHVSFSVDEGEFVFFIGESGAGKSTIFKLLTCEERPSSGEVMLDNFDVGQIKNRHIPFLRRKIGMVFQEFRLIDTLTVGENVAFAMEIIGEPKKKIRQRVPLVLAVVGLRHKINDFPSELSGGEQQRVCIARALVNRPHLIIADEPTGDLDPANGESIMALLDRINRNNGTTIITCSHDSRLINKMNKRVIEVHNGVLVRDDACGQYFSDNERCSLISRNRGMLEEQQAAISSEILEEGDRALEQLRQEDQKEREQRLSRRGAEDILSVDNLRGEEFFEELRKNQTERRNRPGTRERREQLRKRLEDAGLQPGNGAVLTADTAKVPAVPSVAEAEADKPAGGEENLPVDEAVHPLLQEPPSAIGKTSPYNANVIRKRIGRGELSAKEDQG